MRRLRNRVHRKELRMNDSIGLIGMARRTKCKLTSEYTFIGASIGVCPGQQTTLDKAYCRRPTSSSAAGDSFVSELTRSRLLPASPSAHCTITSRARMRCSPLCSRRNTNGLSLRSRHMASSYRAAGTNRRCSLPRAGRLVCQAPMGRFGLHTSRNRASGSARAPGSVNCSAT